MIPRVRDAKYVRDFVIRVYFADDVEGEIDLERDLEGEIFEPLRDISYFRRFVVHPELQHTYLAERCGLRPRVPYQKLKYAA